MLGPLRFSLRRLSALLALTVGLGASSVLAGSGFYHQVRPGETLDGLARRYRISSYEIARNNRITPSAKLMAGSRLWIPAAPAPAAPPSSAPAVSRPRPAAPAPVSAPVSRSVAPEPAPSSQDGDIVVRRGDSLWGLANKHDVTVEALAAANGLSTKAGLEVGQRLRLPDGRSSSSATSSASTPRSAAAEPAPARPASSSSNSGTLRGAMGAGSSGISTGRVSPQGYSWPLEGTLIRRYTVTDSEKFFGVNIAAPVGSEVRAAKDGKVAYVGDSISAYGRMVILEHDGGIATCYAHNSSLKVKEGQSVRRGDLIALSGNTGHDDRPHLHFQFRRRGNAVDPLPYLP